ncbi:glutamate-rich protein 6 [Colius striatus]|uniref:glutamate-rich protein 6 n=1 Tax=Colius striatus TaxID=57412 RepID=UPI002B1D3A6F|nr:glutamate-rich protein 6 [Colius striatus]
MERSGAGCGATARAGLGAGPRPGWSGAGLGAGPRPEQGWVRGHGRDGAERGWVRGHGQSGAGCEATAGMERSGAGCGATARAGLGAGPWPERGWVRGHGRDGAERGQVRGHGRDGAERGRVRGQAGQHSAVSSRTSPLAVGPRRIVSLKSRDGVWRRLRGRSCIKSLRDRLLRRGQPRRGRCVWLTGGLCRRESDAPGSAEPMAMRTLPGTPAPVPTAAGRLRQHAAGKSAPSEESCDLAVLCDMEVRTQQPAQIHSTLNVLTLSKGMTPQSVVIFHFEFKEDFVKLFKKCLHTLPSVGPPSLLARRAGLSRQSLCAETEEDSAPRCEYCGSLLKPFPSSGDVSPPPQKFCCERNRDLYEFIVSERQRRESSRRGATAAGPHGAGGLLAEQSLARRQQERQMARQLALLAPEPTPAPKTSSRGSTISYLLSQEPPSLRGRTLMPSRGAAELMEEEEEEEEEEEAPGAVSITGGKVAKNQLLQKFYKHGGKFLTVLPDGSAQIFYPSGNLAVTAVREKSRAVCMVWEDEASGAALRAMFRSDGSGTCSYPSGALWMNMNIQGGQYLDQAGNRVRRWMWPSSVTSSGPQIPLSPIFISLNRHVGVRILGQDKITVSFLAMGQQAKFNVGIKVQGSDAGRLPPRAPLDPDELLLLAFRVRILCLLHRLQGCLNFPSHDHWDKIKPPAYLITQTLKVLQLCTTSDVSEELRSLVRAIVNTQF